jgi:hypothetical protein
LLRVGDCVVGLCVDWVFMGAGGVWLLRRAMLVWDWDLEAVWDLRTRRLRFAAIAAARRRVVTGIFACLLDFCAVRESAIDRPLR